MCALSILPTGGGWVLLDRNIWEIGQYGSVADALTAARTYLKAGPGSAFVLVSAGTNEWREDYIEVGTVH